MAAGMGFFLYVAGYLYKHCVRDCVLTGMHVRMQAHKHKRKNARAYFVLVQY